MSNIQYLSTHKTLCMKQKKTAKKKVAAKKAPAKGSAAAGKIKTTLAGEFISGPVVKKGYISGQTFGLKEVTYAAIDGQAIFEGDIILGSEAEMDDFKNRIDNPDAATLEGIVIPDARFRWPDGVIVFRIDPTLPSQQRVTDAINHIAANTNLRFRQRTTEANFITFRPGGGCSSQVGMRGGEQFINLAPGCLFGQTVHEICHAAGLWHEQSREDRNNFVTIHFSNIIQGMEHNFNQQITDGDDVGPYDYASIMHYPRNAFARNPANDTITPRPNPNTPIGQRNGLSPGDIRTINAIYPRKSTLGDTSSNGPALTTKGNTVLLGWTGAGNLRLNFMSSVNGLNFTNKVTLGDTSPAALGLTAFNDKFFVAWVGTGNNRLNIMQSNNGLNWTNKVTLGDTSQSAPSLTVFNNTLYLAWRGVGNNQLNIMRSADGIHWGGKVTLGDTTASGPSVCQFGTRLLIAWRGVGNNRLNVMSSANGSSFSGKVTLGDTTLSKPQIFAQGGNAVLTWRGIGNNLLNALFSNNGTTWVNKFISSETTIDGPEFTNLNGRLVWGWTGTDAAHRLNTLLFSFLI
jgi:Astacin (Peptidase family M12A)